MRNIQQRFTKYLLFLLVPILLGWTSSDSPDGHIGETDDTIRASTATTLSSVTGTAHKGGDDQADADTKGVTYALYMWRDLDKDGEADSGDEPIGYTSLTADPGVGGSTLEVGSTTTFLSSGFVLVESEAVKYTGKTGSTLTGCTRGYNETSAASHAIGTPVTAIQMWENAQDITCDGSPDHAIGWDASGTGVDDGTEGNLIQGSDVSLTEGRAYMMKLRVIDAHGNTNTEVGGIDTFYSYGTDSYIDEDGDATQGLADNEVWRFRVNAPPRRN